MALFMRSGHEVRGQFWRRRRRQHGALRRHARRLHCRDRQLPHHQRGGVAAGIRRRGRHRTAAEDLIERRLVAVTGAANCCTLRPTNPSPPSNSFRRRTRVPARPPRPAAVGPAPDANLLDQAARQRRRRPSRADRRRRRRRHAPHDRLAARQARQMSGPSSASDRNLSPPPMT